MEQHHCAVFNSLIYCGSCGSSLVSLEVFSPAQILLILQTTTIRHWFFLCSFFSIFLHPIFHLLYSVFFKHLILLVRILWYPCYLFSLSFIVSSILSLLLSVLHLDLVCTLSFVLFLVSSLLYIYYSFSLSLFP